MSAPAKAVYLIAPGYRRWIAPDATELVFETEGFAPNESTLWQANLTVRDLDSNEQTQSTTPIDLSRKTFTLPVPKFHRRAEIILFIEDRRREPVAEGRWKLTNIPKEELPGLSYFDSRGVFFHEGVGRFPIVAMLRAIAPRRDWREFAEAGYSGLAVMDNEIDEKSAALAASLKLMLFPFVSGKTDDEVKRNVQRLRRFPPVAGYIILSTTAPACRMTDPSRPIINGLWSGFDEELRAQSDALEEVDPISWIPDKGEAQFPVGRRLGKAHVAIGTEVHHLPDGIAPALFAAVARGASGLTVIVEKEFLKPHFVASVKAAAPVVNAVVRGTPLSSDDSTEDHWFWRRRLGPHERAVIEVKRGEPPTATFKIEKVEN